MSTFHGNYDEDPEVFLSSFLQRMGTADDRTEAKSFIYYLDADSLADEWFEDLPQEEKMDWITLEASFYKRWLNKEVISIKDEATQENERHPASSTNLAQIIENTPEGLETGASTIAKPPPNPQANPNPLAKSGSDWSRNELLAYNISVQFQDVVNFFGHELGSIDHLDPNLLSSADPTIAIDFSKETYRFLAYLDLASRANAGQESAIHDLAKSVLEVIGFDEIGTIFRTRYDIPFTIFGDGRRVARSDVCLVHLNSMILLVVQKDKTPYSSCDPEPQIIAEAIATFRHNNRKRADRGLPQLDAMTIPCITMVGTRPFFYQIPVTQQLSDAVATGQFPSQPTVVRRCAPPARRRTFEGMEVPDYRRTALQYYDAFRGVVKDCWTAFLDGCD